ncbi:MAG: holo-ACP synthase [Elusimicrobiota bacterium]
MHKNFGVGVDIEEVARFKSLIRNKRFLKRVYTDKEITYCRSKKNKEQHFAVRFAAKEAVWKVISQYLSNKKISLAHYEIGVKNSALGKPEVELPAKLGPLKNRLSLSLSHTKNYAVAVAMLV